MMPVKMSAQNNTIHLLLLLLPFLPFLPFLIHAHAQEHPQQPLTTCAPEDLSHDNALLGGAHAPNNHSFESAACDALAFRITAHIPNSILITHAYYPAGGELFALMGQHPSCARGGNETLIPVPLCRLVLEVATSSTSATLVEAWLPPAKAWTRRTLATGNGGIGGCVDYPTMQTGVSLGFAAFGTNGGHNGSVGHEVFLGKPEVLIDFGGRSVHVEAQVARTVARLYYGRGAGEGERKAVEEEEVKSYFVGCSSGGRQAVHSALCYPADFDGLLAGAPGVDWVQVVAMTGIIASRVGQCDPASPRRLRPGQWGGIVAAQIEACDGLDGVEDGVIDDPNACARVFDAGTLACDVEGGGVLGGELCLSGAQVEGLRELYEPIEDGKGQVVFPPFEMGASASWFGSYPDSYNILTDFFRGAVYNDSSWSPCPFTVDDMDFAVQVNPGNVHTLSGDLSDFRARGGKLLMYHGRADQAGPSAHSKVYFHRAQEQMRLSLTEMHEFVRLVYVPGMEHCFGGVGAWAMGQAGMGAVGEQPGGRGFQHGTRHSALLALVAWVEDREAPEMLVGTQASMAEGGFFAIPNGGQRGECSQQSPFHLRSFCLLCDIDHLQL